MERILPLPPNRQNNQKDVRYVVDGDCWICTSHSKDKDGYYYARRTIDGVKHSKLHRIVYHFYRGKIEEGNYILHSCDNPSCINPDHLSQGTHQDNMDDRMDRGRYAFNGLSRLSKEQVLEIYDLAHNSDLMLKEIAKIFDISTGCVADIKHKRSYKTVLEEIS